MLTNQFKLFATIVFLAASCVFFGCTPKNDGQSGDDTVQTPVAASGIAGKIVLDESPALQSGVLNLYSADSKYAHKVTAYNLDSKDFYQTTSSPDGEYAIAGMKEGNYEVVWDNPAHAKKTSKVIYLPRETNVVIDVVLQAAANIKGFAPGALRVFVPGTDLVGLVSKEDGFFELTGVPMGKVALMFQFDQDDSDRLLYRLIDVRTSGELQLDSIDFSDLQVAYVEFSGLGVTGAAMAGIGVHFTRPVDRKALLGKISMTNSSGEKVLANIEPPGNYEHGSSEAETSETSESSIHWILKPDKVPEFGSYTITMRSGLQSDDGTELKSDHSLTTHLEAVTSNILAQESRNESAIIYIFPLAFDSDEDLSGVEVRDGSGVAVPNLKASPGHENHALFIRGNFRAGEDYTVTLPQNLLAKVGTSYARLRDIDGYSFTFSKYALDDQYVLEGDIHKFRLKTAYIRRILPPDESKEVEADDQLAVEFGGAGTIDTGSIEVDVSTDGHNVFYTANQLSFHETGSSKDNCRHNDFLDMVVCEEQTLKSVTVPDFVFKYARTYTITARAKDTAGNALESKKSVIQTIVPAMVGFEPNSDSPSYLRNLDYDIYRAKFNVPMNPNAGSVVVEEVAPGRRTEINVVCGWGEYRDDYYHPGDYTEYRCRPEKVEPDKTYEIAYSGFKPAYDGELGITESYSYKTPSKMLVDTSVQNGAVADPKALEHKVSFNFFGVLTQQEKDDISGKLRVKSGNSVMTIDATHPAPKVFFSDLPFGTRMVVAFTMEYSKSYEIGLFDGDAYYDPPGIFVPSSLLTFVTIAADAGFEHVFDVIESFTTESGEAVSYEESAYVLSKRFEGKLTIPVRKLAAGEYCSGTPISLETLDSMIVATEVSSSRHLPDEDVVIDEHSVKTEFYSEKYEEDNEEAFWCFQGVEFNGYFKVDYDKSYRLTLDAGALEVEEAGLDKILSSLHIITKPTGDFKLEVDNPGVNSAPVNLSFRTNIPLNVSEFTDNDILNLVFSEADIKVLRAEANGETFNQSNPSADCVQGQSANCYSTRFDITVKRSVYGVLQYSIGGGAGISAIDINTGEVAAENYLLASSSGLLEIIPDFTPMRLVSARAGFGPGGPNSHIAIKFSRLADPDDFQNGSGDITLSSVPLRITDDSGVQLNFSEASFKASFKKTTLKLCCVRDEDSGAEIEYDSDIRGVAALFLNFDSSLDFQDTYLVELIDGRQVTALGGAQSLPQGSSLNVEITEPRCIISGVAADSVSYNDPLSIFQWHLNNTGQSNFSQNGGIPGADLNMMRTINTGCSGKGALVAVVDSGLEIAHEDLAANVVPNGSYDMGDHDNDPTPSGTDGDHGTSVAGLIASAMDNGKGGRGVAPEASLKGFNFLENQYPGAHIEALGGAAGNTPGFVSNDVHIFNMSYGVPLWLIDDDYPPDSDFEAHLAFATSNLRDGKGAIYVKAAGNDFDSDYYGNGYYNTNMEASQTSPWLIVAGALNADGVKASYSSVGSTLWISSFAGEFGTTSPAMLTTDLEGCDRGYTKSSGNVIGEELDPNCNYMHRFNGTSSAAPVLTGVIALMLETNPDLTWRDVKHIIAKTARKVEPDKPASSIWISGEEHVTVLPWITNQAGFHYHNWYGFGAVDVDEAFKMIMTWQADSLGEFVNASPAPNDWIESGNISLDIPDYNAAGVSHTINAGQISPDFVIEAVQIQVNITHAWAGDFGIELTSPHGTKSILLNAHNSFTSSNLDDMQLLSNAFYGETMVNGDWTLRVVDVWDIISGSLNNWRIRFWGHMKND